MNIKSIPIPEKSLIQNSFSPTDYEDNYSVQVNGQVELSRLPVLFFKCFPTWFKGLMGLREIIVRPLGLKTATGMDIGAQLKNFTGKVGETVAVFNVMGRSETEIMTGEDDKHLNFRLSFFAIPNERGTEIQMATTVKYVGWMGQVYFFPVKPIHRLIMPIIMRRIQKRLNQKFSTTKISTT